VVLRAARQGVDEGFCCLAAEQTAGRGRQGRTWVAPPGSALLASVLLRRSAALAAGIPFAAGLALIDVLHGWGVSAALKWPNDVLVDRRKLAGILSEVEPTATIGDRLAIALGVGVNLSVDSFPPGIEAVSLHTLVARPPSAEDLLQSWGDALRAHIATLERGGIGAILDDWRRCAAGLGGWVTVNGPAGTIDGVAVGVADDGALLVEASGQTHRFLAGDVHLGTQPG
jgi:BirA family transcriptional regulator, biotin operon repressor / biotin---[acetyl-CoA-carboxylase] ligase